MAVNQKGRTYRKGYPLDHGLRGLVIDEILLNGGHQATGYFAGQFSQIANKFRISNSTVKSLWEQFCNRNTLDPLPKRGGNPSHLTDGDLFLMEVLLNAHPTITHKELQNELQQYGNIIGGTSTSAISKALRERMPTGKEYSRKKVSFVAEERFTVVNMMYTQMFINYLHSKDPNKLKFFDEAGLKVPDSYKRVYGYAPKGERCIDITRYHESPNITLNLLAGIEGIKYANIVDGPSDTIHFLNFWAEAAQASDVVTGRPALEVGDIVIMDNCPTHHHAGGQALEEFLGDLGMELVYMPTYSPDFNPAEFVFSKMRNVMQYKLQDNVMLNLKASTYDALDSVNASDMVGYFRATSYI